MENRNNFEFCKQNNDNALESSTTKNIPKSGANDTILPIEEMKDMMTPERKRVLRRLYAQAVDGS